MDVGILNYALTLEYLEAAFYNEAAAKGKIHSPKTKTFLTTVVKDENYHVKFLKTALGSKAAKKPKFNFMGITGDEAKFEATAFVLENTGVHAYLGQAGNQEPGLPDRSGRDRDDRGPPFRRHRPDHRPGDRP